MGYGGLPSEAPVTFPRAKTPKRKGSARSGAPRSSKAPKKRSPAKKKPCKYGARVNGKCPPKPKAKRFEDEVWLPEEPKATAPKPRKRTKAEAKVIRRAEAQLERAGRTAITKGATKVLQSKAGQRAAAGATKTARYLGTSVTALSGAGAAGAVGLAIAAGVGSFLATRAILGAIRDRKERAQQAAYEAARAMRQTRLEAEDRLGRPLTVAELQRIKKAFNLTELMRKAGL